MDIIKELKQQNAYLRKLIEEDIMSDSNQTLTKEIEHNNNLIKQLS